MGDDVVLCFCVGLCVGLLVALLIVLKVTTENEIIEDGKVFKISDATYRCEKVNELKYEE